jgi:hypothetical protein
MWFAFVVAAQLPFASSTPPPSPDIGLSDDPVTRELFRSGRWNSAPRCAGSEHPLPAHPRPRRRVFMVVGVMSAPQHFAWRQAIRETWFRTTAAPSLFDDDDHSSLYELRFIIGRVVVVGTSGDDDGSAAALERALQRESLAHGDVVRVPVLDGYGSLISKLLHFLDWAATHFRFQFLFRANDDVYADLRALRGLLQRRGLLGLGRRRDDHGEHYGERHRVCLGSVYTGRPIRAPAHKNHVTAGCYRWSALPLYAAGPYLLLSAALVRAVVAREAALRLRIIEGCGSLEDMQLGVWLLDPLGSLRTRPAHTAAFNPFFHCHGGSVAVSELWAPHVLRTVHEHRQLQQEPKQQQQRSDGGGGGGGGGGGSGLLCHEGLRWMGVQIYESRLRLAPRDRQAHNNLAVQLLLLGELPRAAAALRRALRIDPRYASARTNLRAIDAAAEQCQGVGGCNRARVARIASQADRGIRILCETPAVPSSWFQP